MMGALYASKNLVATTTLILVALVFVLLIS